MKRYYSCLLILLLITFQSPALGKCQSEIRSFLEGPFEMSDREWESIKKKVSKIKSPPSYQTRYQKVSKAALQLDKNTLFKDIEKKFSKETLNNTNYVNIEIREALLRRAMSISKETKINMTDSFLIASTQFHTPHFKDEMAEIEYLKRINKKAREIALLGHKDQEYGDRPYSYHLHQVRDAMKRFFNSENPKEEILRLKVGTTLWLHDAVEDTSLTLADVYFTFGKEIGDAVDGLTNIPRKSHYSKETEPETVKNLRKKETKVKTMQSQISRIAKLFDRISNTEQSRFNSLHGNFNLLEKYQEEWRSFYELLYVPGEAEDAWRHLNLVTNFPEYGDKYVNDLLHNQL